MANSLTPVDEVIAEAASIIKNFTEQEKQLARQWAFRAVRRIGASFHDIQIVTINMSDYSFLKPTDYAKHIDFALFDSAGKEIVVNFKGFSKVMSSGKEEGRIHEDLRNTRLGLQMTEDSNYFNVEDFTDSDAGSATLKLKYYSMPIDVSGYPKIPETHVMAVVHYIRWQWTMRERKSLGEIQEAQHTWKTEAAAAYGRMKTPTMLEGKEIAEGVMMSMVQKATVRKRQY
jgi:hypothetical protein